MSCEFLGESYKEKVFRL